MKIALYNCFAGQPLAETGLSRRMAIAAGRLGWQALETSSSVEINRFNPDFVLALHFFTPKLTAHPTYGCMWSPPAFFKENPEYVKRILSYDGFLSSSPEVTSWLEGGLANTQKNFFIAPFFTSCHAVPYRLPQLENPRLLYAGTNWDQQRHRELFELLDGEPYVDVYGGQDGWRYLRHAYRGLIPVDGESILGYLNRAGAGLCLHKDEHREAGTPSLRIFEIAASGAVAICQPHPFITKQFGDSVLYVDCEHGPEKAVSEIASRMQWIASHRSEALALSRQAYEIFAQHFTFEKLLTALKERHTASRQSAARKLDSRESVTVVLRVSGDSRQAERALESLATQQGGNNMRVMIVPRNEDSLTDLVSKFRGRLLIEVRSWVKGHRSTVLWDALGHTRTEFVAAMDETDVFYKTHIFSLLAILKGEPTAGVAYSGAMGVRQAAMRDSATAMPTVADVAELAYFESGSPRGLPVTEAAGFPNNFLARASLLENLPADPQLDWGDTIFLLMHLASRADFVFSHQVTMQFDEPRSGRLASADLCRQIEGAFEQSRGPASSVKSISYIERYRLPRAGLARRALGRARRAFSRQE